MRTLRYLSVCSGIEAASVAWHELPMQPVAFSEIEAFPSAVLAQRYPDVPNLGDMTAYDTWELEDVDLLVGGTPCQSFSLAGERQSLDDERGNLCLTFCNIADKFDPGYILWENVPGVLNTKDNAFGCFLGKLCGADQPLTNDGKWADCGVVSGPKRTVAWRIIDAQWFGVAQRRRRLFVLATRGHRNFECADILLPIGESLPRYFEESGGKRERITRPIASSVITAVGNYASYNCGIKAGYNATGGLSDGGVSPTVLAKGANIIGHEVIAFEPGVMSRDGGHVYDDISGTLRANPGDNHPCYCIPGNVINRSPEHGGNGRGYSDDGVSYTQTANDIHAVVYENHGSDSRIKELNDSDSHPTITAKWGTGGNNTSLVQHESIIRRMTPTEAETLQGFPKDWTKISWKGKPIDKCPLSLRYKAIGNSMAVPVMRWIGSRICKFFC